MVISFARLFNVSLRLLTLLSKFALVFLLAKLLGESDFALYGLFTATVAYALMAVGFDFYAYSTREIINSEPGEWVATLRNQAVFYFFAYLFVFPVFVLVFLFDLMPWSLFLWFFVLLVLEHLSQEFNRVLIAISKPLEASLVLFLRQGFWAILAAGLMWYHPGFQNLEFVLGAWALGGCMALLFALYFLKDLDRSGLKIPVDWQWIKRGVLVSIPFVLATLSLKAVHTVDRYWIEFFNAVDVLAAYVLFIGLANSIMSFLDASVFSFTYPALVSAAGKNDRLAFIKKMKELLVQVCIVSVLLSILVIGFSGFLLEWVGKESFGKNIDMLYLTVFATLAFALSMIPHYGLYALKEDRSIVTAHLLMLPVFFALLYFMQPKLGENTVPSAMLVAFLILFLLKSFLFYRFFDLKKSDFFEG